MTVSALMPVFNEEARIAAALETLQWCDEIVVLDKNSTDRTREIAAKHNAKVIVRNEDPGCYDPGELEALLQHSTSEWVIIFTASDVIDCRLASEIARLVADKTFAYDVISVPFKRYVLGLDNKRSPWFSEFSQAVYRKRVIKIDRGSVHCALDIQSQRVYQVDYLQDAYLYHLTHETVDMMMNRNLRYWRGEAKVVANETPSESFRPVLRALKHVLMTRQTPLLGWDGIMLGSAYLSYFMMSFVYKWESRYSHASATYREIRDRVRAGWRDYHVGSCDG